MYTTDAVGKTYSSLNYTSMGIAYKTNKGWYEPKILNNILFYFVLF
jgi:hypothetical protein